MSLPLDRFFAQGMDRLTAAAFVNVSPNTFDAMVSNGTMPTPHRAGRRKIWNRDELVTYLAALPKDGREARKNPWDEDEEE